MASLDSFLCQNLQSKKKKSASKLYWKNAFHKNSLFIKIFEPFLFKKKKKKRSKTIYLTTKERKKTKERGKVQKIITLSMRKKSVLYGRLEQ